MDAAPGQADGAVMGVPDAGIDETCTPDWCALTVAPSSSKKVSVTPAGKPWVVVGRGADERRNGEWFQHKPSCGSAWSSSPSGTATTLMDIDGSGDAVWVVGDGVALRKR